MAKVLSVRLYYQQHPIMNAFMLWLFVVAYLEAHLVGDNAEGAFVILVLLHPARHHYHHRDAIL